MILTIKPESLAKVSPWARQLVLLSLCLSLFIAAAPEVAAQEHEEQADQTAAEAQPVVVAQELVDAAIQRSGGNAAELTKALQQVPEDQRTGMRFLVAYMPERDLHALAADYLLENVNYAYKAWREAPWHDQVPEALFLNDVLPYACINERRDNWRKDLYERFHPLVSEAKTPSEAVVLLNQKIFPMLEVHFSRERPKADQSPFETIKAKKASCSGLSVLLVDACRAVGVPARFAGTPLWSNLSGNHSWVEVWDGNWHYTGAAEPSGDNLDQAWFSGRAKTAVPGHALHAIFATSFRPTGNRFPLVWDRSIKYVHAVDVTARYLEPTVAKVETPDTQFDIEASMHALRQLDQYLALPRDERPELQREDFSRVPLTRDDAKKAQQKLWQDHEQRIRESRKAEMDAKVIEYNNLKMPFAYTVTGDKPAGGRSLYLSMHGGGGAPKRVNDSQWENQKRLYQVPEGVYLAPRAPTDTWNLWHQGHIDPMFDRLIENLIVFENVDSNRVYLMGYSAGGDGVYQVAPRYADRLAAASMMAGHPNDANPLGLRNLPFSIQVGGNDAAYDRNKIAERWNEKLDALQKEDPEGYPHWAKVYPDKGHWMDREDAVAVEWMSKQTRNPFPDQVVWYQDDVTHQRFYWLAVDAEHCRAGTTVRAELDGQQIDLQSSDVKRIRVRLNDQMVDLDQPVQIRAGDKELHAGVAKRTIGVIANTLAERGDPNAVFTSEIEVELE